MVKDLYLQVRKDPYSSSVINVKGVKVPYKEKPTKGKDQVCVVITKSDSLFKNSNLGKAVWIDSDALEGKVKEKDEKKSNRSTGKSLSWEDQRKEDFSKVVHPRLLKIASLLEQETINNAERLALAYLKYRFEQEYDRDIVALAAVIGLYPIGGSAEILWNANESVEWTDKIKIIEKLIQHINGKGFPVLCTVLALIDSIDDEEEIRTHAQIELDESVRLNWNELMDLMGDKREKPGKKSKKGTS